MKFNFLTILCFCNELFGSQRTHECYEAGFYCTYQTWHILKSVDCPIGYYCAANSSYRTKCPNNKTTLEIRSSDESDCLCKKGYYLINVEDTCMPCPVNKYKSEIGNSECQSCPSNSQTFDEGSESPDDCLCKAGFTSSNKNSKCIPCPINRYKSEIENSECHSCRSNSQTIDKGSKSPDDCLCNAGFTFSKEYFTCIPCPINRYKSEIENSECHSCRSNSQTIEKGSESPYDCLCNAGFTLNRYSTCIPCPFNTYKTEIGNYGCHSCPSNSQTLIEGSESPNDCLCNAGFTLNRYSTCIPCSINTYKSEIENYGCHSCPFNSHNIDGGSKSIDDCICNSNFEQNIASKDSFKCECQKGFELNSSSNRCKECKFGSYKNFIGNSECLKCSNGLTFRNKDKLRVGCLRYSIIYVPIIAGTIIVILFIILSIMFCKKRNGSKENQTLNRYF